MIDEINHLKLGFESFALSVEDGPQSQWERQHLRQQNVTFAKIRRGDQTHWTLATTNIYGVSDSTQCKYRDGPVYEAEKGTRLLNGKRVNAERYLDFYRNLPTICISKLQNYEVQGTILCTNPVKTDNIVFSRSKVVKECIDTQTEAVLVLDTAAHVLFFEKVWAQKKELELISKGQTPFTDDCKVIRVPIFSETLSLF